MQNDSDIVKIGGDFIMDSTKSHDGLLSSGIMEIGGDVTYFSGGSSYNFCTSETHTVVLNGSEKQKIKIESSSHFTNLKIENTSTEDVDFESNIRVLGKLYNTGSVVNNSSNLYIAATTEFPDNRWNYDASFMENRTISTNLSFGGSVFINASITLENNTPDDGLNIDDYLLTVDGDVWLYYGTLDINNGGLYVRGDLNLSGLDKRCSNSYLNMQNANGRILVNGNMYVYSGECNSILTAGTIEIKGDFTQKYYNSYHKNNFYCSGSHKVILSGKKLQTVFFESNQSQFNVLEIQNFSEDGVVFSTVATIIELFDYGCNVSLVNGGRSGWMLEKDEIFDGDLDLSRGTLDLNGHKLTVTGNLIQSGGNVFVNGGEMDVQGTYRIQTLNGNNYTTSAGIIARIQL